MYETNDNAFSSTDPRVLRGLAIAAEPNAIKQIGSAWSVVSQGTAGRRYTVSDGVCDCPDFELRGQACKHVFAVEIVQQRITAPDGTVTETQAMRVTYSQEWRSYNRAQTHEHDHYLTLLRSLCDGIEQPAQMAGRPRLPLSDVVFALGVKTYSTLSARRASSFIRDAAAQGLMDAAPSYNTSLRYLESPALTEVLKSLIEESAKPLASIESDFAIDSTGIGTTTYRRWYDHKWGKERSMQTWVKLHAMCGVTTNIITAVEATATESGDAPQLPALLGITAQSFEVREISADKAYLSRRNLHAIDAVGAQPFIPFKAGSTAGVTHHKADALWNKVFHYYQFQREEFLTRYHKRSNVETTFSMLKAKFGANVRAQRERC